MISSYYIYRHIRPDLNQVFYIGLGKEGSKRSSSNSGRNKHWKNVVATNLGSYKIEVMLEGLDKTQAIQKEVELIQLYGQRTNHTGTLVNVLKGGQLQDIGPNALRKWSEKVKQRMSQGHIGNKSNSGKIAITDGISSTFIQRSDLIPKGWKKGMPKRGKMPDWFGKKLSASKKGLKPNLSPEERLSRKTRALGNKAATGYFWISNGKESKYLKSGEVIPEGWNPGRPYSWSNQAKKLK